MNSNIKLLISISVGIICWNLAGYVNALDPRAWHIFSVFMAVLISFILRPYPLGMSVLLGLIVLLGSGTISLKESLSGFSNTTVWLVIAAFLLAHAVITTGFGIRVSLYLVIKLGKSMKGLAYAICGSEFLLASVIPSNTARGGGLHAPIVDSLSRSIEKASGKSVQVNAGRFLSLVGSHANLIAASMYLTGMAANPLVSVAAADVFGVEFGWGTWLLGAIVPGVISLLILPQVIYKLAPPTVTDSSAAQKEARVQMAQKGPLSRSEWIMMGVLIGMLLLWSTQFVHGFPTTMIAWVGVAVLLISGAQTWNDVIRNEKAWDSLFWLGGLLTMASMLSDYGFIQWFVDLSGTWVSGYSGLGVVIVIGLIYFYSMYAFSMTSGHIAAMAAPMLAVCLAANSAPMLSVAIIAYFTTLCACTTNYSSGPVIIYYGLGYETSQRWFKIGFLVSLVHVVIYFTVGLGWWKFLGWW